MTGWQRVAVVGAGGELRAPGRIAAELARDAAAGGVVLTGHPFGAIPPYARLLCRHLASLGRPWAAEADLAAAADPDLLALARRSGCRVLIIGPDPDPLAGDEAARRATALALRHLRRAGIRTVLHLVVGRPGDDAGVFARAVALCAAGRVAFPELHRGGDEGDEETQRGFAWARRTLYGHRAIWRRTGRDLPALIANYRIRRRLAAAAPATPTAAMRLARALAAPIRVRERVAFVSTLASAVHAGGDHVRHAWLRARAARDQRLKALVIRLEGTVDARAARTLAARVRRAVGRTGERIVIDVAGVEQVSLTLLTRFLEEHAARLGQLRGRLAFRNLAPALAALRHNLHGMLPNAALLERDLEELA
ncbi:MAG TPA: STAS domain-containing protein [Candidatus Binatia bacterium]|nr:STAS domain-containing protein [Candidatus Binatia bacterium]